MKISSSTPCFHCWVPWSTGLRQRAGSRRTANSETATVMMPAIVISRLRRSEIERLADEVARARDISSRRRRRRAPGRGRAMPWSSSITRRRIASTMRWSWVAITTVVPVRLMRSSRRMMPTVVAGSRFPVGSSASRMSGRLTNARAIDTRCCSPPESSVGKLSAFLARPTRSRICGTCVRTTCRGRPITSSANATFS